MTGLIDGNWLAVSDGDPRAIALYSRHYSVKSKKNWRVGIGGPGERMILLTQNCDALWVWRRRPDVAHSKEYHYEDGQRGVMCSVFRNEGPVLSSTLVSEAVELALQRWPAERLFTYVEDSKVRRKRDPGRCFRKAGWRVCGRNADGRLTILEYI